MENEDYDNVMAILNDMVSTYTPSPDMDLDLAGEKDIVKEGDEPIILKLTSVPYTERDVLYYIQCRTTDKRMLKFNALYHPNNDPDLYVIYLGKEQFRFTWNLNSTNKSMTTFVVANITIKNAVLRKVFDSVPDFKVWVDKWNDNYGSIYKLVL